MGLLRAVRFPPRPQPGGCAEQTAVLRPHTAAAGAFRHGHRV